MPRSRYPALWIMFFTIGFGLGYPTLNLTVVVLLRSVIEGRLVTPLQMASDELAIGGASGLLHAAVRPFTSWVAASLPDTAHMP